MGDPDDGVTFWATESPAPFEPYTHTIWRCPECGHEVWLPKTTLGIQADHSNRPFCTCEDQGVRMNRVSGVEGRIRL